MLAVSTLRDSLKDEKQGVLAVDDCFDGDAFPDFGDTNLLDTIDFDDLFIGITDGDDVLPDLEMDPSDILADFSVDSPEKPPDDKENTVVSDHRRTDTASDPTPCSTAKQSGGKSKAPSQSKNNNTQGKRKVKVDWTPELHRRFVQAVEQLGVDKAVPSRILEIMGIDCLTRHNIASHLQKYRSHRKHLLAREAEAASWSQRRQLYGKREVHNPTIGMGFPPPTLTHFRPLHVWGHPTVDQSLMHVWPPKPAWPHPHPHYHHPRVVPNAVIQGAPYFPQPDLSPRLIGSPGMAAGIPQPHGHGMYKLPPISTLSNNDFLPSKESIDAAIGDVIAKPWLPLPLGLRPPSTDGVMLELQRQGVPKVPPSHS